MDILANNIKAPLRNSDARVLLRYYITECMIRCVIICYVQEI